MTKLSSTPENWGDKNKKLIVDLLKEKGPLSRAQISRRTGMSSPAVSSNVQFLLDHDYIYEAGVGNNSMGRKSMLLSFNASKGYVIGLDLGRSSISLVLANLLGGAIYKISKEVDIHRGRFNLIDHLDVLIRNALKKNGIEENTLLAICIGIPGVLDKATGKMILIPFAGDWTEFNILEGLQQKYRCPIAVENSVNLGALGEKRHGCGIPFQNIIYINYSIGIGSALILNNTLYTGSDGVAGEIGYAIPSPLYMRSSFKEEGALEEIISGKALDERVKAMDIGVNSLRELFESDSPKYAVVKQDILHEREDLFFVILLASISVINPSVVILSGRIGINIGRLLKDTWEKSLSAHFRFPPRLLISKSGSLANVLGAVWFALSKIEDELCAS